MQHLIPEHAQHSEREDGQYDFKHYTKVQGNRNSQDVKYLDAELCGVEFYPNREFDQR